MLKMKVQENESSTYATFVPGNESSQVRKFQLPLAEYCLQGNTEVTTDWLAERLVDRAYLWMSRDTI